ncbi:chromatin remodeling complex subunit (Chd3), putative [Talaromyces stipitatus ATCC 10500]|uniref:Chromatin remodeling complex subunit (Chd3), putative n=1 Tax=Talaromyces stipitatus (strain ATCC 10500 / CBS 375.48 / QM 6759 / NRRL 1006) TaxID=441959 RepID=B8M9F1_TALSN|nr:chromatin remodeling complex subunit (Chd3), putative [Talaromyces stipitatus ATCC 10500]EED17711.1 chromatin remodeling complex subunit (Chd3), putative [Talaromyces stipitatus ATCC 10500]
MPSSDKDFSSGSEDADELVVDLLQQFSSVEHATIGSVIRNAQSPPRKSVTRPVTSTSLSPSISAVPAIPVVQSTSTPKKFQTITVEVPPLPSNAGDYKFLPGHSTAWRVWGQKRAGGNLLYEVELASSEKEWLNETFVGTLENGSEAIANFKQNGPPKVRRARSSITNDYGSGSYKGSGSEVSRSFEEEDMEEDDEIVLVSSAERRCSRLPGSKRREARGKYYDTDDEDSDSRPVRRSRRASKHRVTRSALYSNDEKSSDDVLSTSTTVLLKRRRSDRQATRTIRRIQEHHYDDSNSNSRSRGVRSSARTGHSHRNSLRERLEDDIPEVEASQTEKRFSGAKEKFYRLSNDDPFRQRHRQVCDSCDIQGDDREKGPLVFCQGCTSAYHKSCLGPRSQREHLVTKVGWDHFVLQCRRCLGTARKKDTNAPHLGHCTACNEENAASRPFRQRLNSKQEQQQREKNSGEDPITPVNDDLINNVDNVMFRCVNCQRAFHLKELPPICGPNLEDTDTSESDADLATVRLTEYSRRWQCHTCISAPGEIEALVGWRPVDADAYIPGYTANDMNEVEKEYLVKWKKKSYYRTTWMEGSWIWGAGSHLMRKVFFRSPKGLKPQMTAEDAIPEDYLRVDLVFDVKYTNTVSAHSKEIDIARVKDVKEAYVKYKGLLYEDAVWETVPSPTETERWNDFKAAYEDWVLKDYVKVPKASSLKQHLETVREQDFRTLVKKAQPACLTGGKLMDYQLDGLNWLYYKWYQKQNAILADEMGLGKTIQIISFLSTLIEYHRCWPFLIVVPNSTCPNWRREVKRWAPSLCVVTYYGSVVARKLAHDLEMFPKNARDLRAHILVTSYETMVDDKARRVLASIPWAGLVVDEGQRLKNDKNLLYSSLSSINFPFKVLLTGTPLQNNIRELFNLIQFCDPTQNAEDLEAEYETLTKENVPELHAIIRPFFLRRTKAQVLTFLPPMAQIIIPVSMSVVQKKLYKSILAKNSKLIKSIFQNNQDAQTKQNERHSLSNILMQLRKCLCHPFVYSRQIEERTSNPTLSHRNLVEASGKLRLLELLLPRLKERGHRVLLFSQFLDNLDIVEDFLDGLGLFYCRLDGSMGAHEKQKKIDAFNAPDSTYFAFLLSTRSGGVGINLATADTVIIMDPDFNPHQDIQALSRAHRIGQQKKVLVFQLMTRESAEEKIMQIGKKKMALDHVLIEKMDAAEDEGLDLESILRHGAEALFEDDTSGDVHYDAESVEKLLDRSQAENTQVGNDASAESQFSFARVWANDNAALEDRLGDSDRATPVNNTLWEKILAERQKAADEEALANAQALGRGKRKRTVVNYSAKEKQDEQLSPGGTKRAMVQAESDDEFRAKEASSESDDEGALLEFEQVKKAKARPFKRVDPNKPTPDPTNGNAGQPNRPVDRLLPCLACNQIHPVGYCPLKLAGVEHCALCGIAHLGYQRVCPHLNSEEQILSMLQSLRQSTEPKWLVDSARHYLCTVKREKAKADRNRFTSGDFSMPPQPNTSHSIAPDGRVFGLFPPVYGQLPYPAYPPPSASNPYSSPYPSVAPTPSSSFNIPPNAPYPPAPPPQSLPPSNGFKMPRPLPPP